TPRRQLGPNAIGFSEIAPRPSLASRREALIYPARELRIHGDLVRNDVQHAVHPGERLTGTLERTTICPALVELGVGALHEHEQRGERFWRIEIIQESGLRPRNQLVGSRREPRCTTSGLRQARRK